MCEWKKRVARDLRAYCLSYFVSVSRVRHVTMVTMVTMVVIVTVLSNQATFLSILFRDVDICVIFEIFEFLKLNC